MMKNIVLLKPLLAGTALIASATVVADSQNDCRALPGYGALKAALDQAVADNGVASGG